MCASPPLSGACRPPKKIGRACLGIGKTTVVRFGAGAECGQALETVTGFPVKKIVAMKKGVKLWHDRDYTITNFPAFMEGGHYIEQAHKSIKKGSAATIKTMAKSKIYVAVETGGRDGGFRKSLPKAGWKLEKGSVAASADRPDPNNTCCTLKAIYSYGTDKSATVKLPATATDETVMVIVVVPICDDKGQSERPAMHGMPHAGGGQQGERGCSQRVS